jgi:hypothetical protein
MVTAIVLLSVARARVGEVADKLASTEGISEVYSVAGRFDLVAMVRVRTNEDLADIVTNRMQRIEGIESTETLIAFRAYSRVDLEGVFSIGMKYEVLSELGVAQPCCEEFPQQRVLEGVGLGDRRASLVGGHVASERCQFRYGESSRHATHDHLP